MSVITVTVGNYTYDETQIIINPTISKSICSGGFSVGNTACGCLKVGVPNNGHSEGDSVKISYGGQQIMGEFFISEIEKAGYAKLNPTDVYKTQMVMLTCYDGISKLDDYMTFSGTVTPADICDEIESQTGYIFEDGSKLDSLFEVTKEEAESRTMREWLGIFGCYVGCNWSLRSYWLNDVLVSKITQLPLYYSGYSFSAVINAPVSVENAVTFSRVVSRGKDGTFKSGTDTDYTLEISCQYATQDSNDIIQSNIENQAVPYTAFKCDKLKTDYISMDIGDEITLNGHSGGLKIYNQTVTISINGIYMSVGADVQKKTLNEDINYSSGGGLENVSNFQGGTSGDTGIVNLTWVKPSSAQNVIVKRKRSTPFNNAIDDGEIIAVTSGNTLADTLPSLWYSYHYRTLTNNGDLYNGSDNQIMIPAITRGKYLYNAGDECTAITGGWKGGNGVTGVNIFAPWWSPIAKNAANITISTYYSSISNYFYYGVKTANKINFTGFTKICAEFEITQMRTYDITNGLGDDTARSREMPYYSYADTYYSSSYPAVTAEQCPYVVATFRLKNYYHGAYYVYFLNQPPMLVYDSNGVMKLSSINSTTKRTVIYYGDTQTLWKATTDGIDSGLLIQAPGTPDTVTYGDYMGGGYETGNNYVYAFSGFTNPILPPEYRVFVGTRNQSDYIFTSMVSKGYKDYKDGLGTFVVEAPIVDLDTSVVPNVSQAWVCAGALESNVKLLSVWLKE